MRATRTALKALIVIASTAVQARIEGQSLDGHWR